MMRNAAWIEIAKSNLAETLDQVDASQLDQLARKIHNSRRIFILGNGRTGLVGEMFAMRLAQLGLSVWLVGHPTTPGIKKTDLLILISGSGETSSVLAAAEQAAKIGAERFCVTGNPTSSLAKQVTEVLLIPTLKDASRQLPEGKVFSGTLFETSLLQVFDLLVNRLLELSGQTYQDLDTRHANLV
jgi:6-phospho-3-hexuloisomerase